MLKRLGRDRRGVSAVEFALIAPIMILIYFGLAELTMAMMAERRASHTASVIADLVAQTTQINSTEMTAVFKIGQAIMKPFPTGTLKMRVTSVKADAGGTPKVVWSQGSGMSPLTAGANVTGFPAGLVAANESVVMTETAYAFTSPLKQVLPNAMNFSEKFYLRPRKSVEVAWVN
jgi:Flp pilus assembly protein TadG